MKTPISLILLITGLSAQTPEAQPKAAAPEREPGLYATIRTSQGDIVAKLFELEAPITVQNFVDLARGTKAWKDPKTGTMVKRPLFPGTIFHRVIPGFMIQGGDPDGNGTGGASIYGPAFEDEINADSYGLGTKKVKDVAPGQDLPKEIVDLTLKELYERQGYKYNTSETASFFLKVRARRWNEM